MPYANDLVDVGVMTGAAWALLEMALKGTAILMVGAACALAARGASAAVRHVIWTVTLGAAAITPLAGVLLPRWRVPVPAWVSSVMTRPTDSVVARAVVPVVATTASDAVIATSPSVSADQPSPVAATTAEPLRGADVMPEESVIAAEASSVDDESVTPGEVVVASDAPQATTATLDEHDGIVAWRSTWFIALWIVGFIVALLPPIIGAARVSSLVSRARPMRGGRWALLVPSALREIGVRRHVRFLELGEPVMPMTSGAFRPVVLLPAGDFDSTIAQRLDVLRHELAHVRRYDCLTQLIGHVACALNWYNPLAWLAAREMRVERERACDDEVLRAGTKASDYADYLMRVARETRMSAAAAFGALAMARPSQLSVRLRAVLEDGRRRGRASTPLTVTATIGAGCVVAVIAMLTPAAADARVVAEQGIVSAPADIAFPPVVAEAVAPAFAATAADVATRAATEPMAVPAAQLTAISVAHPSAVGSFVPELLPERAAVPHLQQASDCDRNARTRGNSSHSNWTSSNNGSKRWRVVWSEGDCSYEVEARGEIKYNRDVTDIESISAGGSFTLEEHIGDDTKRIAVRPKSDGTLEHQYSVNGERRAYDETARAWFAKALIALDRRTAFAVDQRVPAILQAGGVDAVLREIDLLDADYARRKYYTKLLSMRQLDAAQVRRVVEQAGAQIDSDYELAELLIAVAKLDAFSDASHGAFVTAVKTIDSDYEARRALNALLKRDRLAPATVEALLDVASTIDSDYELAELLIAVSKEYAINDRTRPAYIKAVGSIESDYEHRRVLSAILAGGGLTPAVTRTLLEDARSIESDYELAEFLIAISQKGVLDASTRDAYFAAADKIKSDYEHRRALTPLIKKDLLTKELAKGILASATKIESDYECSELLIAVANAITIDQDLRPAFDRAADTIQGEYEYGRAMSAVRRSATR